MLSWDDEILALTETEIQAFRRVGSDAVVNTYLDWVREVLSSGTAAQSDMRRAIDSYLASLLPKQERARLVAVLRAKVLRRWFAESWVRTSSRMVAIATRYRPPAETGSSAVRAKRLSLLGAPPEAA